MENIIIRNGKKFVRHARIPREQRPLIEVLGSYIKKSKNSETFKTVRKWQEENI